MTTQQYEGSRFDVEGSLGSTALLLLVLYFLIPALASLHLFSLMAGVVALVSGLYSTVRELLERQICWLGVDLPVTFFVSGAYILLHLHPL